MLKLGHRLFIPLFGLLLGGLALSASGGVALATGPTTIPVYVTPSPLNTADGNITLSNFTINGVSGSQLSVSPGANVTISGNYADNNTSCTGCIDFVAVGFAGSAVQAGCTPESSFGSSGSFSINLGSAPTTFGTYNIVAAFEEEFSCGGHGFHAPFQTIAQVTVLSFGPLLAAVQGLPPGTSLNDQALAAQTAYNAGHKATACQDLKGFINEATAQSGKKLTSSLAQSLIAQAQQLEQAIGC